MGLRINRIPPGLLSLLDAQSSGQNPVSLHEELSGTIELGVQYAAASGVLRSATTGAAAAVGRVEAVSFRAAAGELLVCTYAAAQPTAVLAAGVSARFRLVVYDYGLGGNVWGGTVISGSPTELPVASTDRVLFIPPGYGLGVMVEAVAGAGATFVINALCSSLKV
jgi:hypothetical protein